MYSSVQFLRFVAAAMVVATHSSNVIGVHIPFGVGNAGVDIFFVISGFVIGVVSDRETSVVQFYLKRFIRIFPMYWLACSIFFLFPHFMLNSEINLSNIMHSLLLIPKFEKGWWPMLFPAWTLSYEVFFYLVFGLVIFTRRLFWPVVLFLVLFATLTISGNETQFRQVLLLEFVGGLLVARFLPFMTPNRGLGALLVFSAVAIMCYNYGGFSREERIVFWGIPSVMLVMGALHLEAEAKRIPRILGDASYSIYLFHITIMSTANHVFRGMGFNIQQDYVVWMAVLFSIAIPVSVLIHVLVERPLQRAIKAAVLSQAASFLRRRLSTRRTVCGTDG